MHARDPFPSELLEKLAVIIPRPRINLLIYRGAGAPRGTEGTVRQFGQFDSVAGDGSRGWNNDVRPPGDDPAELSELAHRPGEP